MTCGTARSAGVSSWCREVSAGPRSDPDIQRVAQDTAAGLPKATSGYPFTEHLQVWKVAGKVFLIVTEGDPDLRIITVKVDPDDGDALRHGYESVGRGHYLNKRHWISVAAGPGITSVFVEELVQDSYELARAQLPVKDRPE